MSGRWEVRRGICRTVILTRRYAIKLPRWARYNPGGLKGAMWTVSRGIQANLAEIAWAKVDGVCPVLWSFGGIVNIYPRAEPWPADGPAPDYPSIAPAFVPTDSKRENIGILNGAPVWIDYDNSWNRCPHSRDVYDRSDPVSLTKERDTCDGDVR